MRKSLWENVNQNCPVIDLFLYICTFNINQTFSKIASGMVKQNKNFVLKEVLGALNSNDVLNNFKEVS